MAARRVLARALALSMLAASVAPLALGLSLSACSRPAPDATPEGAVRLWLEKMEASTEDPRAARDAYQLLGPRTRHNLEERAERASRAQGRRFEAHEMIAPGRFGMRFRPHAMTARIDGDTANVDVVGEAPEERATVPCVRVGAGWRIEVDLPPPPTPSRRPDGGL